jgi:cyanamide hydratase
MSDPLETYGWTAVPRSQSKLLDSVKPKPATKITTSDITVPSSPVVQKVYEYAKAQLPEQTFNHSMRVFYYGKHCHSP